MSKPIDEAYLMKDACLKCYTNEIRDSFLPISRYYSCKEHLLGQFSEPCTLDDWARCPFNPSCAKAAEGKPESQKPALEKSAPTSYLDDLSKLEFESRYKFYLGCSRYLKKSKQEIDLHIVGLNLDNPKQREEAWEKVVKKFSRQPIKGG